MAISVTTYFYFAPYRHFCDQRNYILWVAKFLVQPCLSKCKFDARSSTALISLIFAVQDTRNDASQIAFR